MRSKKLIYYEFDRNTLSINKDTKYFSVNMEKDTPPPVLLDEDTDLEIYEEKQKGNVKKDVIYKNPAEGIATPMNPMNPKNPKNRKKV